MERRRKEKDFSEKVAGTDKPVERNFRRSSIKRRRILVKVSKGIQVDLSAAS